MCEGSQYVKSSFIISLDTELYWGWRLYPNSKMAKILRKQEAKAIESIDDLLQLFEKYKIPVTWAVVGKVFLEHPEIIEKILSNPIKHEIAYHSFSHVPLTECGYKTAEVEVLEGVNLGRDFGISFTSFVFPEDKIKYTQILKKYGFQIYRGLDLAGRNENRSLPVRVKNVALSKVIAYSVKPVLKDGIWEIPSSMCLYYPSSFYNPFPDALTLVNRAKRGIERAIKQKEVFHIFWHPEDLLIRPWLLDKLEEVLRFIEIKKDQNDIYPTTMRGLINFK